MSNAANGVQDDVLEGLQGIHGAHGLQFGDVGLEDISPDSHEDNNTGQDADPINIILERQAMAIEKLASGIKEIAQALREIAVALAPQNLERVMPIQNIESPID